MSIQELYQHRVLTVTRYTTKKFSREGINVFTRRVVERIEPVSDVERNFHLLIRFVGKNDRERDE